MRLRRTLRPALLALLAHRARAGLAFISVSVGVAAIVVTSGLGAGAEREMRRKIDALGVNLLMVRPAQVRRSVARRAVRGLATTLTLDDARAIAELPEVAAAAPGIDAPLRVKAGASAMIAAVVGTSPEIQTVRRFVLTAGRFLRPDDDRARRRVAVLGGKVAETLFPEGDAVGRELRLRGLPFEVIGVLAEKGVMADGSDLDTQVLIPIQTALRRVWNVRALNAVYVSAPSPDRMPAAQSAVAALLRSRHRVRGSERADDGTAADDFAVQDAARFLVLQRRATGTLGAFAGGLAVVALVVGGFGILALMLLAVKERTGEIGLRMAIGARSREILVQFLLEASLLSLGGWLAGAALGGAALFAIAAAAGWSVGPPLGAHAASFLLVTAVGLGFGAVPARRAALLRPVEALRHE
jgi:putative ABC transport system permease protein